jgi:hypothetical protein
MTGDGCWLLEHYGVCWRSRAFSGVLLGKQNPSVRIQAWSFWSSSLSADFNTVYTCQKLFNLKSDAQIFDFTITRLAQEA